MFYILPCFSGDTSSWSGPLVIDADLVVLFLVLRCCFRVPTGHCGVFLFAYTPHIHTPKGLYSSNFLGHYYRTDGGEVPFRFKCAGYSGFFVILLLWLSFKHNSSFLKVEFVSRKYFVARMPKGAHILLEPLYTGDLLQCFVFINFYSSKHISRSIVSCFVLWHVLYVSCVSKGALWPVVIFWFQQVRIAVPCFAANFFEGEGSDIIYLLYLSLSDSESVLSSGSSLATIYWPSWPLRT